MISLPANYVLLQRIELNASASSISFTNIPQSGYTDLKIVYSGRDTTDSPGSVYIQFNGAGYNSTTLKVNGTGSSVSSSSHNNAYLGLVPGPSQTANTFSNGEIYIPNYTSSTNKSFSSDVVNENNATAAAQFLWAGLWANTAAITSVTLKTDQAFAQYSTFSLYGLAAVGTTPVIAPKASGGNITSDGTYWIHTFNSTGTFTPLQGLSCDYLVVAGGGGAGSNATAFNAGTGGGGAGGLRSTVTATGGGGSLESALSVASGTAYTITVGAGGAGGVAGSPAAGSSGSNSVFSTITSTGGGGGGKGGASGNNGLTGGSGGGGGANDGTGAVGTVNQGYTGGNGATSGAATYQGGGGAGAGANGNAAGASAGGGGNGVAVAISGSSVTYAGGGGGGIYVTGSSAGGTGGGGNGVTTGTGGAGTTNSGGGGGGGGTTSTNQCSGGNGGSGIVVIRYPIA